MFSVTALLRITAKDLYQSIVSVVAISLFVSLIMLPGILFLPWQLAIIFALFAGGPVWFGASRAVETMLQEEKGSMLLTFLKATKTHCIQGIAFACFFGIFVSIVASSWWLWVVEDTWFAFAIACFQTYFAGMVALSQLYTVPLVIKYGLKLPKAMLVSMKLLLANPLYTIAAFLQLILFTVLLSMTIVGHAFLLPGVAAVFVSRMTSGAISRSELVENGVFVQQQPNSH
ncbi:MULTISPECIES: hypothetical protein [Shouchella]|uniref:DUF624 domain-containing protein n=2 Tax=Shouchella TaxID=2893057 RepID=Q5WDA5_SHOC1|nr:hypothetical protein [Shouchella clausii]BAD65655.1 hypothetical protein ABC3121 [Shouchella clausii KSM-K16]